MKRLLRIFWSALTASILSACTAGIPSVSPSVIGIGAFMSGTWRQDSKAGRDAFYVVSVDGALVRKPTRMKDWEKPFSIGPGERFLVIDYEGYDPILLRRPRLAKATVKATLVPGVHYVAEGHDEGRTVTMWIQRQDTGERVSPETMALKEDMQFVQPLFVPVPRLKK